MSHFTKIKTKINNKDLLKKSLTDLQISWELRESMDDIYFAMEKTSSNSSAVLKWHNNSYELVADSNTWQEKNMLASLLDRIQQSYAYNTILSTSAEEGFNNIGHQIMKDGSVQIVLEKWSNQL